MAYLKLLDYRLFEYFNSWAGKNHFFDFVVVFLAHWAAYILPVLLVGWWFCSSEKMRARKALVMAFISFIVARFGVAEIVRLIFPRSRPFLVHQVTQLISKDMEKSFPSGHATAFFAIAMAIYFYNKKLGAWLFVLAALVSLGRVIAGIHYPLDIIAGAIIGIVTAWIIERLFGPKLENFTAKLSERSDRLLPFTKR